MPTTTSAKAMTEATTEITITNGDSPDPPGGVVDSSGMPTYVWPSISTETRPDCAKFTTAEATEGDRTTMTATMLPGSRTMLRMSLGSTPPATSCARMSASIASLTVLFSSRL